MTNVSGWKDVPEVKGTILSLQRTHIWFLTLVSSRSQVPATPDAENSTSFSGHNRHLYSSAHRHTNTHIINNFIKILKCLILAK